MKKNLTIIGIVMLLVVVLALWAVPVFAATPPQADKIIRAWVILHSP
jgi:hypothetical protein